jgi:hypothetical protein
MVDAAHDAATDSGQLMAAGASDESPHAPFASPVSSVRAQIDELDDRRRIWPLTIAVRSDAIDSHKARERGALYAKGSKHSREHPRSVVFGPPRGASHCPTRTTPPDSRRLERVRPNAY